ncbi:MAG: gamma-glutamyltransferase [Bacteriovoracaceae bacterium]
MSRFAWLIIIFMTSCSQLVTVDLAPGEKKVRHFQKGQDVAIATQGEYSTKAAQIILSQGGNLADAAVAASFVISVERPQSTGLGGGGFLLYYRPGMSAPIALDFREQAPIKAHSKMYLNQKGEVIEKLSLDGALAVGVPGLVAGLYEFHQKYGKKDWEELLAPAIDLAMHGFEVYPELAEAIADRKEVLSKYRDSKKIFLKENGEPLKKGDWLVQKDLGKTLITISKTGKKSFYEGELAKKIQTSVVANGGVWSEGELAEYQVKERRPIKGDYKNYQIYSMSPPSSGGVHVIQILNMVENDNLKKHGPQSKESVHLIASSMQQAFADRAKHLGDSDFSYVPVDELSSKNYAREKRRWIPIDRALKKDEVLPLNLPEKKDPDHTTHFSMMNKEGEVVVSTQTINGWFGSGLVAEGTGIVLNNEMDDFATKVGESNLFGAVGGEKNLVEPKKRPLSSMSPTIVLDQNGPIIGVGTPSGTRILTCVAQTLLNLLEFELSSWDSVALLRYHHQWSPDHIRFESDNLPGHLKQELESMGHKVIVKDLGCRIQLVRKNEQGLEAVSDPRGSGDARAW